MRSNPRTFFGSLLAAGALLATGALAGTAGAAPSAQTGADKTVSKAAATSAAEQERVRAHWTPERMRAAVPIEQLAPDAVRKAVESAEPTRVAQGEARKVAPTSVDAAVATEEASASSDVAAFPEGGAPWTDGGAVTSTAGRVFFTYDGQDSSCSGNAVTSENGSTVMTAGHCVKLEGAWHTDWQFVPAYADGEAPHGEWAAESTHATPQWEEREDMNYDVGAALVGEVDGERLTDVVGGQGLAFNTGTELDVYAFGYPAADPYDGESLIYCGGTTFVDPLLTDAHGLACDMTGGSSGGPWFTEFDESTGEGLQTSVNSFGYVFLPDNMFGPQFGDDAEELYETVQTS